ncbi:MAG: hypothetical protein P4L31_02785 [Candidatus Babeliales bacterium]|nr:hypothetical protein [Candidatus Babeliales bacterium]
MKKIALSALLLTTAYLHGIRGFETTTQKAVKRHKAQQLKSEKKALLKPLQKEQTMLLARMNFVILGDDQALINHNYLTTKLCSNAEIIDKIKMQKSKSKTKTVSEWALLAQRQPKIEKAGSHRKDAYRYQPHITEYACAWYEKHSDENINGSLSYMDNYMRYIMAVGDIYYILQNSNPDTGLSDGERAAYNNAEIQAGRARKAAQRIKLHNANK